MLHGLRKSSGHCRYPLKVRILADENLPYPVIRQLREWGHDVTWAAKHYDGANDAELVEFAEREGRVIVTLDLDFWQISIQRRPPLKQAGVVIFRVGRATVETLAPVIEIMLAGQERWHGKVSLVTPSEVYVWEPDIGAR